MCLTSSIRPRAKSHRGESGIHLGEENILIPCSLRISYCTYRCRKISKNVGIEMAI